MTNIFNKQYTNLFNSNLISKINAGLTKEQADALYINQLGDSMQGPLIIDSQEINGIAKFNTVPMINSSLNNSNITSPYHLATKSYIDVAIGGVDVNALLSTNNTWTGNNNFSNTTFTTIPNTLTDITASIISDNQLVNKKYTDNKMNSLLSKINTWSEVNTFGKVPIFDIDRTLEITDDKHFTNKKYVDSKMNGVLISNNQFTGTNEFINGLTAKYNFIAHPTLGFTFKLIPMFDMDRSDQMLDPNCVVNKSYVDKKTAALLTNVNTYSGFNEFQGGLRVRYMFTANDSGVTFTTVPKLLNDVSAITDDNHFITKKYLELGKASLVSSGNDYTGANTFTNLIVPNCCGLTQANGAIYSVIPKTDIDRTLEITDDNHFTNKKYVDNKINNRFSTDNNFGSTTQTMYNNTVTNKLVVAYCMEAPLNAPVKFSYVPTLTGDFTASITSNNQLVNKSYVDQKITSVTGKILGNTYIIGEQTYTLSDTLNNRIQIVPPRVRIGAGYHTLYINFPALINESLKNNYIITNTATFTIDYFFTQNCLLSGYTLSNVNANQPWSTIYSIANSSTALHNNANLAASDLSTSTRAAPIFNFSGTYTVTISGGKLYIYSSNQSVVIYDKPVKGKLQPAAKTITTYYNGAVVTVNPLQISSVSSTKIKIELGFPLITNNTTINNDVNKNDWIASYGTTIKLVNSAPYYDQSLNTTVLNPDSNQSLNTNTGSAYLSLS